MLLGLAPMDGYTDCAFRQIVKEIFDKYGEKKNYTLGLWTEFMTADGYIAKPEAVVFHLMTDTSQHNIVAQIHGGNTETLLKTLKDINKKYAKHFVGVELNTGCPANNIMKSGGGSELLKDKKKLLEIIKILKSNSKLPFSIKTRTGLNEADKQAQFDFLVEASNYCDMITIHGRTTNKVYSGEADWKFIYEIKKEVAGYKLQVTKKEPVPGNLLPETSCKIIGNGGIKSYSDIEKYQGILDGIMIGQAAIGNPRIFTPHIPSREEIKETILKHLDYMIGYKQYFHEQKAKYKDTLTMPSKTNIKHLKSNVQDLRSIVEFRKHLFQYVKGIPGSKEFKQKVATIVDYDQLVEEIQKFFVILPNNM